MNRTQTQFDSDKTSLSNCMERHSYYSVDALLATQQRIPCKLLQDTPYNPILASASPSMQVNALKEGTKLDLPLYLVEFLAPQEYIDFDFPKYFDRRVQNSLKAGSESINLRQLNPYFYAVAERLVDLYVGFFLLNIKF